MPRATQDTTRAKSWFRIQGYNLLWPNFSVCSPICFWSHIVVLQPPLAYQWVWALPRSLAATKGISVDFFSCGYLDVSVPHVCSWWPILFSQRWRGINLDGFPHSEISGSMTVCVSPKLIAAYRVLHRFPEPRHPPCALSCLTSISSFPLKKISRRKNQKYKQQKNKKNNAFLCAQVYSTYQSLMSALGKWPWARFFHRLSKNPLPDSVLTLKKLVENQIGAILLKNKHFLKERIVRPVS